MGGAGFFNAKTQRGRGAQRGPADACTRRQGCRRSRGEGESELAVGVGAEGEDAADAPVGGAGHFPRLDVPAQGVEAGGFLDELIAGEGRGVAAGDHANLRKSTGRSPQSRVHSPQSGVQKERAPVLADGALGRRRRQSRIGGCQREWLTARH